MKKRNIFVPFIVILLVLIGYQLAVSGSLGIDLSNREREQPVQEVFQPLEPTRATIAAVGDVMMHSPQFRAGYNSETGEYNFDGFFREVKPFISGADIATANLEVPLAGKEQGYTGYPLFNSPSAIAGALKYAGFDIITTANNHTLDRRASGAFATLDNLDRYGLKYTGSARSQEERDTVLIENVNGIQIAFLAYTYGTNGIPVPREMPYVVNLIDEELIQSDVQRAREEGADFVVVSMHWGYEYHRQPNSEQKRLAAKLIGFGVDVILGSHPHVLQPGETITVSSDDGEREGFVIYSLGNFVSNQQRIHRESGVILWLEVEKDLETNQTQLVDVGYIPTWVQRLAHGKPVYRVLPVEQGIYNYEQQKDPLLSQWDYGRLQESWKETVDLLGEDGPMRLIRTTPEEEINRQSVE